MNYRNDQYELRVSENEDKMINYEDKKQDNKKRPPSNYYMVLKKKNPKNLMLIGIREKLNDTTNRTINMLTEIIAENFSSMKIEFSIQLTHRLLEH